MYWPKSCDNTFSSILGMVPTACLRHSNNELVFGFSMSEPQTIASVFFFQGDYFNYYSFRTIQSTGSVYIGDSTNYESNEKCADISGDGYYTCARPINGKYVTFHANSDSLDNGFN